MRALRCLGLLWAVTALGCGSVKNSSDGGAGGDGDGSTSSNSDGAPDPDGTSSPDGGGPLAVCPSGVAVDYSGEGLPPDISGFYEEAFDCISSEGGANFGGVDTSHCFRKDDDSTWRIWNTGCGWEIGLVEGGSWTRHARYYTGVCSDIPDAGLTTEALTTQTFFDGFGDPIQGLETTLQSDVAIDYSGSSVPSDIRGYYEEAFNCDPSEGGEDTGGVDTSHCFRKTDGTAWRIWNTGCGWEVGLVEGGSWTPHAHYYTGGCDTIPDAELTTEALTTSTLFDGSGASIQDLSSSLTSCTE